MATSTTSSTTHLKDSDIVCGRGGLANKHPGNRLLRRICNENRGLYQSSTNPDYKQCLILSIFSAIHQNGGRFVTRTKDAGWKEISEKKAKEKTAQLLREGAESSSSSVASVATSTTSTKPIVQSKRRAIKYGTNFFDISNDMQAPMKRRPSLISPETAARAMMYYTPDTVTSNSSSEEDLANLLLQPILEPDVSTPKDPPALVFEDGDMFDRIALEAAEETLAAGMDFNYHGSFQEMNHGLAVSACSPI